jgi:hypothetical protein
MEQYPGFGHPGAMPRRSVNPAFGRVAHRTFGPVLRAGLALSLALGTALLTAPAATAAPSTGEAYVIQGLLGETYDVVVDDEVVHRGATPKAIIGPIELAAGNHVIELRKGSTVAIQQRFTVRAGQSVDVVAHKRADSAMSPVLTAFRNDTTPVGPGKVRLTVAHTAAAPPADIRVDGNVLFRNVANAEALTLLVPAKTYTVDIVPAATTGDPILGPVDLPLKAGTLTRVFAIGSVASDNMDAVVHSLPVKVNGAKAPGVVRTGDGGQTALGLVDDGPQVPMAAFVTALGAVLLAAAGGGAMVRRNLRLRSSR